MHREYSLAHLTALGLPPPELIEVAAEAGYRYVGLRLTKLSTTETPYDLINDRELMRATKAALAHCGIGVWDIELARMDLNYDHRHYQRFLEAGAELGVRRVIAQLPVEDHQAGLANFVGLCDAAAKLDIGVDLEFVCWTQTSSLATAAEYVREAARPNGGLLVDTLHMHRSASSQALLRSLPRQWFVWAHVCDAPAENPLDTEGLIAEARGARLFPGEGGIDVKGILGCLPDNAVCALEIPNVALAQEWGYREYARRAIQACESYLENP